MSKAPERSQLQFALVGFAQGVFETLCFHPTTNALAAIQNKSMARPFAATSMGGKALEFISRGWAGWIPQAGQYGSQLLFAQVIRSYIQPVIQSNMEEGRLRSSVTGMVSLSMATWGALPWETIKTAQGMYAVENSGKPWTSMQTAKYIYNTHGLLAFYTAFLAVTARCTTIGASWGFAVDGTNENTTLFQKFIKGFQAGAIGGFITGPFDQARAIQQGAAWKEKIPGTLSTFKRVFSDPKHIAVSGVARAFRMGLAVGFLGATDEAFFELGDKVFNN
eukprot:TRINITY_DN794_c0_g1_i1.p1 TRINITY_DN794_c0_g1~~TRINITY_DN794_c0_g1_i1.p1  ORF type:complete len:278 (-),score=53.39 TRINITY_DN794_c0_g1_i1:14-847(-)